MPHRVLSLILILVIGITGACSLASNVPSLQPSYATPSGQPIQAAPATPKEGRGKTPPAPGSPTLSLDFPTFAPPTPAPTSTNLAKAFPLAPNTKLDAGSGEQDPGAREGSFRLHSTDPVTTVVQFYQAKLPQVGWTFRYNDANSQGGVNQYWKKDGIYMQVDYLYDETEAGLAIQCEWNLVDAQALLSLPKGLPLADQAELVQASVLSWEFYFPKIMAALTNFYQQQLAALKWQAQAPPPAMEGSCGGDCGSDSRQYPQEVTPMPSPTWDPRPSQTLIYTMPDGNEIQLEFTPHQDGTILYIELTLKNPESAGLPKEVPIYEGATNLMVSPGTLSFTVTAKQDTVVQFYLTTLVAAGWSPSKDYSVNTPEQYFQNWEKDGQSMTVQVAPYNDSSTMVNLSCNNCKAP